MPQYQEEGFQKAQALLEILKDLANKKNATMAQISLAWMICKKDFIIPIPGSRKLSRLEENFQAGNVTLTKEEIQSIDDKLETMEFDVFGGH